LEDTRENLVAITTLVERAISAVHASVAPEVTSCLSIMVLIPSIQLSKIDRITSVEP
jgi:hypothetical protein